MATYYKRMQTIFSFGEEDLADFVESQNSKNSTYIKKLIREEMVRQANGSSSSTDNKKEVEKIKLEDGGIFF